MSFGLPQQFSNTSNKLRGHPKTANSLPRLFIWNLTMDALSWPVLPFALSSWILYLGTSSSRIALASFLVTCIIDLGRWSPCSRHCQLAGPPLGPLALLSLENNLTSRQSPAPLCQRSPTRCSFLNVSWSFSVPCGVFRLAHRSGGQRSTVKNDHLAIMGNMMLP